MHLPLVFLRPILKSFLSHVYGRKIDVLNSPLLYETLVCMYIPIVVHNSLQKLAVELTMIG